MSKSRELAKNTFIIFLGTFFAKSTQYFLLPLYTSILTTLEYGTVEIVNTIVSLLAPLVSMQIEQGAFRFLVDCRKNQQETKTIISTTFYFTIIMNCLAGIILLAVLKIFSLDYGALILLGMISNSIFALMSQISRGMGDNKRYSLSNFVSAIISVIFNIVFLVGLSLKAEGVIYSSAIGYAIGILFLYFKLEMYKYISVKSVKKESLKQLLKYSLPMIPNSLSWWIFSSSDRIITAIFISVAATGLLSVSYKFSLISIIIYNVFNMSITESLAMHMKDKDFGAYYNNVYNTISNVFISFCSLIMASMPILFNIFIDKEFHDAYYLAPIAMFAAVFQVFVGILGTMYIAKKNTKSIAVTSIMSAIINIVTNIILIKYIGVYAAVISTLISYAALFIYRRIDVNKKYVKIKNSPKLICNLVVCTIIMLLCYVNNNVSTIISICLALFTTAFVNKDNIYSILKIIKEKKGIKC